MKTFSLATTLACAAFCVGTAAQAETLGRVETVYVAMSQYMLVEMTPGMRTHDRPLVAEVRLRDADGQAARRVMLRLDSDKVEAGDIVAVNEGEQSGAIKTGPLRARDRLARVEAKHDTDSARNFFNQRPSFLALSRSE
jgi:hypothetical protein